MKTGRTKSILDLLYSRSMYGNAEHVGKVSTVRTISFAPMPSVHHRSLGVQEGRYIACFSLIAVPFCGLSTELGSSKRARTYSSVSPVENLCQTVPRAMETKLTDRSFVLMRSADRIEFSIRVDILQRRARLLLIVSFFRQSGAFQGGFRAIKNISLEEFRTQQSSARLFIF